MLSDMIVGTTIDVLEKAASTSVDNQHEGIVIKDASSLYKLDTRTKGAAIQLKANLLRSTLLNAT